MQRLKKEDDVIVISGGSKGARGQIQKIVYNSKRQITHVVIEGVNMRTKHQRPNPARNDPGGKVAREMPIHVSNVALYSEEKGGADRVRYDRDDEGKKHRVYKSGGKPS